MSTISPESHTSVAREPKPIIPPLAASYPQLRNCSRLPLQSARGLIQT